MSTPLSTAQEALQALGSRLREIRIEAGLSGRDLGRLTGWHSSKISKIEYGRQSPSAIDVKAWCAACGVADQASELLASLRAVEGMFVEWRRMERTGLRRVQEAVKPIWDRTYRFRIYSGWVVPAPIQTRAYIQAVLQSIMARRDLPDDVDEAVEVRVDRQALLNHRDRTFAIVLEESVLRTRIGGPDTMAGQLGHLLTASTLPNVSLGVIPTNADRSSLWQVEAFWMFGEEQVAIELVSGYLTVTRPAEIGMYSSTFNEMSRLAVFGAHARTLITAAISDLDRV